jgi:hypothetical protein
MKSVRYLAWFWLGYFLSYALRSSNDWRCKRFLLREWVIYLYCCQDHPLHHTFLFYCVLSLLGLLTSP